ncbi:MAG TPA: hypothetical protein PKG52_00355 [bacterium]|nr:hypothetical protein [bacterium]HPS28989.1 hypothetical protein [bacterium]
MNKLKSYDCITLTFILGFLLIILKNAWVCDDSYITFRVIDNFVNGYGLRWNIDERVQAFSNPLWLLIVTPFYFFTHEFYLTSIIISILFSVTAVVIMSVKLRVNPSWLIAGISILICSNSFVDYSTSGLENALSYLLMIVFLTIYLTKELDKKWFFLLFLSAGLVILNRMDHGIIVLPFLIAAFFSYNKKTFNKYFELRSIFLAVAGFIPFIVWILFSIIYYGFPFPNTAYAKLNIGVERYLILKQGFFYVLDFFKNDYIGACAVSVALIFTFPIKKQRQYLPFFFSLVLYLIYILWIGGDFMSGRFFTVMILISVVVIIRQTFYVKMIQVLVPAIVIISLFNPRSSILSWNNYSYRVIENSIADERGYYYKFTGLFNAAAFSGKPVDPFALKGKKDGFTVIKDGVGFSGFNYGPKYHILDRYALGDPFLARIPYQSPNEAKPFRPGHLGREFPEGYVDTIKSGENYILHPEIREFYEKLKVITKSDIFTIKRFVEILRMNSGYYDNVIRNYSSDRSVVSLDGIKVTYSDLPGITISWNGKSSRQRYLIDWIAPDGTTAFSKYIFEENRKSEKWYPYMGKVPLTKGKWIVIIQKITYQSTGSDKFVSKTEFEAY